MTPFTPKPALRLDAWNETRLIGAIRVALGDTAPAAPEGPGDDCAAFAPDKHTALFTTDSLVFGRHFDARVSPEAAGAKLVKRNVSDIAAMGGVPTRGVVAIVCGKNTSRAWLLRFCRGMASAARAWNVRLVGGDMSGADDGVFSATMALLGHAAKPILRTGARAGDFIFVTGELGGSLNGWHLDFTPRVKEAVWLAAHARPSAMMDITDGLFKDLPALLPERCDALLDPTRIPVRSCVRGKDALRHALGDGEDYELLFTLPPDRVDVDRLLARWRAAFKTRLTLIGEIVPSKTGGGALCTAPNVPLTGAGFSHF